MISPENQTKIREILWNKNKNTNILVSCQIHVNKQMEMDIRVQWFLKLQIVHAFLDRDWNTEIKILNTAVKY